jgi:hypothetical protein
MNITLKKTLLASSIALTLGTPIVEAALVANVLGAYNWSTPTEGGGSLAWNNNYTGNMTVLAPNGGVVSGTNTIGMQWDGNAYNASTDYAGPGSATNASVTACCTAGGSIFFGHTWTAHDIQIFVPGTYSFDVTLGGGSAESGTLNVAVGAGQLGMHMLWDWNGHLNIDVFIVFAQNSVFGSGLLYSTQTNTKGQHTCDSGYTGTITKNCLYDVPTYGITTIPVTNEVWTLASVDGNGDGIMGIPMAAGGPLAGFSLNFNSDLTATPDPVPIPGAAWLLVSGLIGLAATARRRKYS